MRSIFRTHTCATRTSWAWLIPLTAAILLSRWGYAATEFYAETRVLAQRNDAIQEVHVNFSMLLETLGIAGRGEESSIRVVEVDKDGSPPAERPQVITVNFIRDPLYDPDIYAAGRVLFKVNRVSREAWEKGPVYRRYRILFSLKEGRVAAKARYDASLREANFYDEVGGFEETDLRAYYDPRGMIVRFDKPNQKLADKGRTGKHSLRLVRTEPEDHASFGGPRFRITPGGGYRISFWTKAENAAWHGEAVKDGGYMACSSYYFYDENNEYIKHVNIADIWPENWRHAKTIDFDWTKREVSFTAPENAHFVSLTGGTYARRGAVYFDDLRIRRFPPVEITEMRSVEAPPRRHQPPVWRFDFGAKNSAVMPWFAGVTPETAYSAETGYGWTKRPEYFRAVNRTNPDPLSADYVLRSNLDYTFRADLANGKYRAWLIFGDSEYRTAATTPRPFTRMRVTVGGEDVFTRDWSSREWLERRYLRSYHQFYRRPYDFFATRLDSHFDSHIFDAEVSEGRLEITFRGMPLCAMVIAPPGRIEREIKRAEIMRRSQVSIQEVPPGEKTADPYVPTQRDAERGFAVMHRHYSRDIFHTTVPERAEIAEALSVRMSKNEMEPVTFTIYPLRDLGKVKVRVSDLTGRARRIPSSAVRVDIVRYIEKCVKTGVGLYTYTLVPKILMPYEPLAVQKGVARRYWLTVRTTPQTDPGTYKGTVTITAERGAPHMFPLTVEVLPIDLPENELQAGFFYYSHLYYYGYRVLWFRDDWFRENYWQNEEATLKLFRDYGFRSLASCYSLFNYQMPTSMSYKDGVATIAPDSNLVRWMDMVSRLGYRTVICGTFNNLRFGRGLDNIGVANDPTLGPEYQKAVQSVARAVKQEKEKRGWCRVAHHVSDEASNRREKGAKEARRFHDILIAANALPTQADMNGPYEMLFLEKPPISIATINTGFPITEETVKKIKDAGSEFWTYNLGPGRYVLGVYAWRVGYKGNLQYVTRRVGDPYDDFDDTTVGVTNLAYPAPHGVVSTMLLERAREGLDDYRYLMLLERLIAKSAGNPGKKRRAEAARALLEEIRMNIAFDPRKSFMASVKPEDASLGDQAKVWSGELLDQYRARIAKHIQALQE